MSIPFYNDIDLNNNKILNVKLPVNDYDVANKIYIDTEISEVQTQIAELDVDNKIAEIQTQIGNVTTDYNTKINNTNSSVDNLQLALNNAVDNLEASISQSATDIRNETTEQIATSILNSINNNLSSLDIDKSLSAYQGYILNSLISELNVSVGDLSNRFNYTEQPNVIGTYIDGNNVATFVYTYEITEDDVLNMINGFSIQLLNSAYNINYILKVEGFYTVLSTKMQYLINSNMISVSGIDNSATDKKIINFDHSNETRLQFYVGRRRYYNTIYYICTKSY